jgi:hypothetical protein
MRFLPERIDNVNLYWTMDSIVFIIAAILIFNNSSKSVVNLLATLGALVMFFYEFADRFLLLIEISVYNNYFSYTLEGVFFLIIYIFLFRKRYDWRSLEGAEYDSNKIQAIYSRPSSLITLLGATTSLSPKCSVRYTHNNKTIRFKRGNKTPILCDTVIRKTDIIEDTNLRADYFDRRWEEIKDKRFNLFTFNCRSLFKK